MATSQRLLEDYQYATTSLVPFCRWRIRNILRETVESNDVSISTNHMAKVLCNDFTKKPHGDGIQV